MRSAEQGWPKSLVMRMMITVSSSFPSGLKLVQNPSSFDSWITKVGLGLKKKGVSLE